jgi:hypothetical protein
MGEAIGGRLPGMPGVGMPTAALPGNPAVTGMPAAGAPSVRAGRARGTGTAPVPAEPASGIKGFGQKIKNFFSR